MLRSLFSLLRCSVAAPALCSTLSDADFGHDTQSFRLALAEEELGALFDVLRSADEFCDHREEYRSD